MLYIYDVERVVTFTGMSFVVSVSVTPAGSTLLSYSYFISSQNLHTTLKVLVANQTMQLPSLLLQDAPTLEVSNYLQVRHCKGSLLAHSTIQRSNDCR